MSKKLSKLQEKMQAKLTGSKFRWLNEQLYTQSSSESKKLFKDKQLFEIYHQGFRSQIKSWPVNPVDTIIKDLKDTRLIVADLGCGDAKIALNLTTKVHSFDLVWYRGWCAEEPKS
jgi:ribosomal RNA-processing protein 8